MDIYLRQTWYDDRLRYSGAEGPVTIAGSAINDIWKPDTYFANEKKGGIHDVLTPARLFKVFPNGTAVYTVRYDNQ